VESRTLSPTADGKRAAAIEYEGPSVAPPLIPRVTRYAALGDSFTLATRAGGATWAAELAGSMAHAAASVAYANFARPGATSQEVLDSQIDESLRFGPDVVTVVCGANDVLLSPEFDACGYAGRLQWMFARLRARGGVRIVTATCPPLAKGLPLNARALNRLRDAIDLLNETTRIVARRVEVPYVELGPSTLPPCPDNLAVHARGARAGELASAFRLAVAKSRRWS
jgi:lysophospholipase L1-like esterase